MAADKKPVDAKKLSYEELVAENDRLLKALSDKTEEVSEAAKRALIISSGAEERPTGKTVEVTKCKNYKIAGYHDDGRPILRPEYHQVMEPTYWYEIDMPPVGGTDIKLNGREFYHGNVYEVTNDELKTLKDIVWRLWAHERSLHEDNEKVFRQHFDSRLKKVFAIPPGAPKGSRLQ